MIIIFFIFASLYSIAPTFKSHHHQEHRYTNTYILILKTMKCSHFHYLNKMQKTEKNNSFIIILVLKLKGVFHFYFNKQLNRMLQ